MNSAAMHTSKAIFQTLSFFSAWGSGNETKTCVLGEWNRHSYTYELRRTDLGKCFGHFL